MWSPRQTCLADVHRRTYQRCRDYRWSSWSPCEINRTHHARRPGRHAARCWPCTAVLSCRPPQPKAFRSLRPSPRLLPGSPSRIAPAQGQEGPARTRRKALGQTARERCSSRPTCPTLADPIHSQVHAQPTRCASHQRRLGPSTPGPSLHISTSPPDLPAPHPSRALLSSSSHPPIHVLCWSLFPLFTGHPPRPPRPSFLRRPRGGHRDPSHNMAPRRNLPEPRPGKGSSPFPW